MASLRSKTIVSDSIVGVTMTARERKLPCLVQFSGENIGRPYFLYDKYTFIGRDPRSGIQVPERRVSRHHAKLFRTFGYVTIEDLDSANGLFVNSKRVRGIVKLKDGDMVRIGRTTFKFFKAGNAEQAFYDRLYRIATIDEKTQVFNDKYLFSRLQAEIELAQAGGQKLSLILYDLDFFKKVNDNFGHLNGDIILKGAAFAASKTIRKNDVLCRYGGEEFAVILPGTDRATALALAQRLCRAIRSVPFIFDLKGKKVQCVQTASLGVAHWQKRLSTPKLFLKEADAMLYKAKKAGRDCVVG